MSARRPRLMRWQPGSEAEAKSRPLNFAIIRRLFTYMRPHARKRNLLIGLVIVRSIQLPLLAWAMAAVIGGPVSKLDRQGILLGALGYGVMTALAHLVLRYRSRLALELGESVIHDIRDAMFVRIQALSMRYFNENKVGRMISRFTSDAEAVRVGIQDVLFVSIVNIGQMLMAAVIMAWYDWVLFLVVVGMAPVIWGLNRYFRLRLSDAHRALQESFSRVTATVAESVSGIRVTQGFSRQEVNAGLFHELVAEHSLHNINTSRTMGVFLPLLEFNTQLFIAVVMLLGGWRALHGATQVEDLYQFFLLAQMFFGPLQTLGTLYGQAMSAMAGAERVFGLLDTAPDWTDPPDAVVPARIEGRVEFRGVSFRYGNGPLVLDDVSFTAEPGQTIALVGHTGGGKSTMINLISKFYLPTAGELLIDGVDIRRFATREIHRHMGIVLQQNFLFTGTVLDNIRVGRPGATLEEVAEAARRMGCLDFFEALPLGFETQVGEGGKGISLGQRQLICFARAMVAAPRLMILDEATSAVDTVTEARIQTALSVLLRDRTSFVVAHRLSTIRHADLVLVIDHGRIVERGNHAALLGAGGRYADLYRQFIRSTH